MIERYGGAYGILSEGTLDYAIAKATRAKDFIEEAAILLETIAKEHPFIDGNKRTAFASAEATLRLNGYHMTVEDEEAIEFLLKAARRELRHEHVVKWIKDRLKRLS
jgi:death-on-curing protein